MGAIGRFILASGLTNLADGVATVAWTWAASLLTRDALLLSVLPFALTLPWFLLALPAGVVTDRVDRRRLILAADTLRLLAFLAVALAAFRALPLPPAPDTGTALPWLFAAMVCAALTVGAAEVFRDNAAQTMLPALVPHDRLERANGRLWSVERLGNSLVGPALGSTLIAWALWLPFALNALAYGGALAMVGTLRGRRFGPPRRAPRAMRAELAEGLAFLRGQPLLRVLALVTGAWNLCFQIAFVALVLHAQENLGLSAPQFGLCLAGGALGGIAGALTGERVAARLGPGRTAQVTLAVSILFFLAVPLLRGPVALALSLAVFEAAGMIWNVVSVSYRQRRIPDALLGRVNSIYRLLAWGMLPLGALLSGLVVRLAGTALPRGAALTAPFWLAGGLALLLVALAWRPLGRGFRAAGLSGGTAPAMTAGLQGESE